jgi:hypothetical protein
MQLMLFPILTFALRPGRRKRNNLRNPKKGDTALPPPLAGHLILGLRRLFPSAVVTSGIFRVGSQYSQQYGSSCSANASSSSCLPSVRQVSGTSCAAKSCIESRAFVSPQAWLLKFSKSASAPFLVEGTGATDSARLTDSMESAGSHKDTSGVPAASTSSGSSCVAISVPLERAPFASPMSQSCDDIWDKEPLAEQCEAQKHSKKKREVNCSRLSRVGSACTANSHRHDIGTSPPANAAGVPPLCGLSNLKPFPSGGSPPAYPSAPEPSSCSSLQQHHSISPNLFAFAPPGSRDSVRGPSEGGCLSHSVGETYAASSQASQEQVPFKLQTLRKQQLHNNQNQQHETNQLSSSPLHAHGSAQAACQAHEADRAWRRGRGQSRAKESADAGKMEKKKKDKESKQKGKKEKGAKRSRDSVASPDRSRKKKPRAASMLPWSDLGDSLQALALDPTLCLALGIAAVTREAVSREATRLGGIATLADVLDKLAQDCLSEGEPWVAGAAWSLAYFAKHLKDSTLSADLWSSLKQHGGNILKACSNHPVASATFFASFPKAVGCVPVWSTHENMHPALAVSSIAEGLTLAGDAIPAKLLVETLSTPKDCPALVTSSRRLGACTHAHHLRGQRFTKLADTLESCSWDDCFKVILHVVSKWSLQIGPGPSSDSQPSHVPATPILQPLPATGTRSHALAPPTHAFLLGPPQFSVPPCPRPHSRGGKGWSSKPDLVCDPLIFQDMRSRSELDDPGELLKAYRIKAQTPEAPAGTEKFFFDPPPGSSFPAARWHLWKALARVGVFLRELYTGTDFKAHINCKAGPRSLGQAVIFTDTYGHYYLDGFQQAALFSQCHWRFASALSSLHQAKSGR